MNRKVWIRLIKIGDYCLQALLSPVLLLLAALMFFFARSKEWKRFLFGPAPILNNKYWAESLKRIFERSESWVFGYFDSINKKNDFDRVLSPDLGVIRFYIFCLELLKFDVFVISFQGGALGKTIIWKLEPFIFQALKKKTILIPFGSDFYQYSKIEDFSRRHTLIHFYKSYGVNEFSISRKVQMWSKYADVVIPGYLLEGLSRWDVLPYSPICIDVHNFPERFDFNITHGKDASNPIKVVHSPNHRIVKGTEYIIDAVEKLKAEGFFVELILLEGMQNDHVKRVLCESDILIDQLYSGYALSAMEGMAAGCVVLSNITRENYEKLMRTFSYLNECPIVSVSNFDLIDQLRLLLISPSLRYELSLAGRSYVEKYHSYDSSRRLFELISKYFHGSLRREYLMNYFHPVLGDAKKNSPLIVPPLIKNKIAITEKAVL